MYRRSNITIMFVLFNLFPCLKTSIDYNSKFLNLGSADDEYISRQKRDDNYQQFRNKRLTTRLVGDVEVVVQGNYIKMKY
jgi:hypothetical protein